MLLTFKRQNLILQTRCGPYIEEVLSDNQTLPGILLAGGETDLWL
jgi:hypothetical protein